MTSRPSWRQAIPVQDLRRTILRDGEPGRHKFWPPLQPFPKLESAASPITGAATAGRRRCGRAATLRRT